MNIQNINELADKIQTVGFGDVMQCLVRRICFHPAQFVLSKSFQKGCDKAFFHFCVQYQKETDNYVLNYYDAVLQKEADLEMEVDGIDIALLERKMTEIDWQSVFRSGDTKTMPTDEKKFWEEAKAIESIISDLTKLNEGKRSDLAIRLKQKFWAGTDYKAFTDTILTAKMKDEVSQRFFLHDHNIISADEAFRFLQNRRMEKDMQTKRKSTKQSERNIYKGTNKGPFVGDEQTKRRKRSHVSRTGK